MGDLSEIHTWSVDRIKEEIQEILPEDLEFYCRWLSTIERWQIRFQKAPTSENSEEEPDIVWTAYNPDQKLALLESYGYLWRSTAVSPRGNWANPQARPTVSMVSQHVAKMSDPEDVDPSEVAAVYGRTTEPKSGD